MSIDLQKLARIEADVLNSLAALRDSDARIRKLRLDLTGARSTLSIRRGETLSPYSGVDMRSEPQLVEDISKWERTLAAEVTANAALAEASEAQRRLAEACVRHAAESRPRPVEPPYDVPRHTVVRAPRTTAPTVARPGGMAADIRSSLANPDGRPRMAASATQTRRT